MVKQVSRERIREELTRMLTEGHARRAFELLDETGLLQHVLPEAVRLKGVAQPPQFHPEGDVWVHTLLLLEKLPPGASPTLAWGALLHDIGKPATYQPPDPAVPGDRIRFNGHVEVGVRMAEVILERLRFSREDSDQIVALVKNHMRFGDVLNMQRVHAEALPAAAALRGAPGAASDGLPLRRTATCACTSLRRSTSRRRRRRRFGRGCW